MSTGGIVSEINIYPVKSLGGIKLNRAIITKRGVAHPDNTAVVDRFLNLLDDSISIKLKILIIYYVIQKMVGSGW